MMTMMEAFEFRAAVKGDASVLEPANIAKKGEVKFVAKTADLENNIVHIAARNGQYKFIEAAIALFPDLLQEKNKKGNTPLHEAAELGNKETINLLVSHLKTNTSSDESTDVPTYMEKNDKGDTPFHVALRCRNLAATNELLRIVVTDHPQILSTQNKSGETPLHLYIRFCAGTISYQNLEEDKHNAVDGKRLIDKLIKANSQAVRIQDSDGLIPHMRAAQYGCVEAALRILLYYPHLSEYRDQKGRSVLHNLRLRITDINARDRDCSLWACDEILRMSEIHTLIFSQDEDGNTPLHLAMADRDFDFAQLILQRCVKDESNERKKLVVSLTNNEGKTVLDLVTSVSGIPANLKKLMVQVDKGKIMDKELYRAAVEGTTYLFERPRTKSADDEDFFLCQTDDGSNILHIAILHGHQLFIQKAMEWLLTLIFQKDCRGDTPLHVAARIKTPTAMEFLKFSLTTWSKTKEASLLYQPPWMAKNLKGNTFLHEAASNSNYDAIYFTSNHVPVSTDEIFLDVNDNGETVLHLVARYADYADSSETVILELLSQSKIALGMHDGDGLTPILRAAQCGQIQLINQICIIFPSSIQNCDYKGRTVLHLVRTWALQFVRHSKTIMTFWKDFSNMCTGVDGLLFSQDHDGNTPLHLAIMVHDFDIAHFLIQWCTEKTPNKRKALMSIKNNDGKSVVDLIIHGSDIPANLIKLIEWFPMGNVMDDKLYEAATKGDTQLFQHHRSQKDSSENKKESDEDKEIEVVRESVTYGDDYFCSQAQDGSNIIHIALQHGHKSFIDKALRSFFDLVYQKDFKEDTPLHVAARLHTDAAFEFLKLSLTMWKETDFIEYRGWLQHPKLWTLRNSNGNTFLHEAARTSNYKVLSLLTPKGGVAAEDIASINNDSETAFHLLARYAIYATTDIFKESIFIEVTYMSPSSAYIRDKDGFTPVLRAVQCGRLQLAIIFARNSPRSVVISDHKKRTVLHHLRAPVLDNVGDSEDITSLLHMFINVPGVSDLRIAQDDDGNTPLHLAITNEDVSIAKFLMEICLESETQQELTIVNNDGHSVFYLLSSKSSTSRMSKLSRLMNRSIVKERRSLNQLMTNEVYDAAVSCNVKIFDELDTTEMDIEYGYPKRDEDLCRPTPDGSTIIHIALKHENPNVDEFIKNAIEKFPFLIWEADGNGDTLFHLAANLKGDICAKILKFAWEKCSMVCNESDKGFYFNPLEVRNNKGNYPIHEALQNNNLIAAKFTLSHHSDAAYRMNGLGETPLHAHAKYGSSVDDNAKRFVKFLINQNVSAVYTRDHEGFTPLLRAASSGRFHVVRAILNKYPQSAYLRDPNGKTFLHLVRFTGVDDDRGSMNTFKQIADQLFKIPGANAQRLVQDNDGNTPLHCAIKTHNSIAAIVLTRRCFKSDAKGELDLVNKEGEAISDLLTSKDDLNEIIEQIRKKVPQAAYLARSSYGIRKAEMKDSANALSVVAGLLATITFAAGIQVPGGFNDDGYSVLLIKPVFQAFLVFNTFAMCGSMLVLFYLLWVMGIGKIHGSLVVLDLSIFLLRASFYSTLLAFTTGVFVTTAHKSFWLAIFISGICFLTFLITFKFSVNNLIRFGSWVSRNTKRMVLSIFRCCIEPVIGKNVGIDVAAESSKKQKNSDLI